MKGKIALYILFSLVVLLVGFYYYLGGFDPIQVREETLGPFYAISHNRTGDYRNVGETFESIQKEFPEKGLKEYKLFGIYLDNPNTVPKEQLRAEVGALFLSPITDVPSGLSLPLAARTIPARKYLVVDFPLKSFFSIFVGIYRVYPKLMEACEKRGCDLKGRSSMEIYEPIVEKNTKYLMPLD